MGKTLFDEFSNKVKSPLTHSELVKIGHKWVLKNGSCGVAFKELNTANSSGEYPDVIGFGSWGHSVLIEVKVSRSDFLCDKKKKFRKDPLKGMGKYRYYMCPKGLINIEDLPERWGLIWVDESGKSRKIYDPYGKSNIRNNGWDQNIKAEHELMYSALRRLHLRNRIDEIYQPI